MSVSPILLAMLPSVIPKAGNPCPAIPVLCPPTKTVSACGPPTTPGSPTAATPPDPPAHPAARARLPRSSWFFLHCLNQWGQHTISRLKSHTRHEAEAHSPFPPPLPAAPPTDPPTTQLLNTVYEHPSLQAVLMTLWIENSTGAERVRVKSGASSSRLGDSTRILGPFYTWFLVPSKRLL